MDENMTDKPIKHPAEKIREVADKTPHITFGYIGNLERWGDDRLYFLWVENLRYDTGNHHNIWCCPAKDLDNAEACKALQALRHFQKGYDAAKKEAETIEAHA